MRHQINSIHLDSMVSNPNSKAQSYLDCEITMANYYYSIHNLYDEVILKMNLKELSQWVLANDIYTQKKKSPYAGKSSYSSGRILQVEFGSGLKNELSYLHPCIVIADAFNSIFVVPVSTGHLRFANNPKNAAIYEIGDVIHGFEKTTAICLQHARWIDKARVIKSYRSYDALLKKDIDSRVDPQLMVKIRSKLLSLTLPGLAKSIDNLSRLNEDNENEINRLNDRIQVLESELTRIKSLYENTINQNDASPIL